MDHDARHLIELKDSPPPRGSGLFAKALIPRGTRIIAEPALLRVSDSANVHATAILHAYEQLPPQKQEQYLSLHAHASNTHKKHFERELQQEFSQLPALHRMVLSIYAANAFTGVFLLISRINHSCLPNCSAAYNKSLEEETVHAVRDIRAGEELTVRYVETSRTRAQRQSELAKWGFRCGCEVCEDTLEGRMREEKRIQLFQLDQSLAWDTRAGGNEEAWRRALHTARKMAALQKAEGLVGRELGNTYHVAARLCLKLGDVRMAPLWAEKELQVDRYCVGEDHPDYEKELAVVDCLKAAVDGSASVDGVVTEWFERPQESCTIM